MVVLSAKQKLIESAARLFYQNGFQATGIESILADAGLSKMTLYRHFQSKGDLIVAVMEGFHERFREWLSTRVEASGDDPVARLGSVCESLKELLVDGAFGELGFHGCPFAKAAYEFDDNSDPIHRIAADHKRWLMDYIRDLARATPAKKPDDLALALYLEFEGAYVTAQVTGDSKIGDQARQIAKLLIEYSLAR